MDDVPVERIKEFQNKLTEFLTTRKAELLGEDRQGEGAQRRADGRAEGRGRRVQADLDRRESSGARKPSAKARPAKPRK